MLLYTSFNRLCWLQILTCGLSESLETWAHSNTSWTFLCPGKQAVHSSATLWWPQHFGFLQPSCFLTTVLSTVHICVFDPGWMSRIPPEFMLILTDGWVCYSPIIQHDLVDLRLEGEEDGRDGTHVTVVTAEAGLQVRTWSSSAEISKRMSLDQLSSIKREAAVRVVCRTEEALWTNPDLHCGSMGGLCSCCHASQHVKVCHLATVDLEGHSLMSPLWDCTCSFHKERLKRDLQMCSWQTGDSSADWCFSSFQLCSLGLITSCFDSCLFAEFLLVQELWSCSNRMQAFLFTDQLLPPSSVLRSNASWDNQEGGRSERQAVSPCFCLSFSSSPCVCLPPSLFFFLPVSLCLSDRWSFSVCLSFSLSIPYFLHTSFSSFPCLSISLWLSWYFSLPISLSLSLLPSWSVSLFFRGVGIG